MNHKSIKKGRLTLFLKIIHRYFIILVVSTFKSPWFLRYLFYIYKKILMIHFWTLNLYLVIHFTELFPSWFFWDYFSKERIILANKYILILFITGTISLMIAHLTVPRTLKIMLNKSNSGRSFLVLALADISLVFHGNCSSVSWFHIAVLY